jgi:hypothetical protein
MVIVTIDRKTQSVLNTMLWIEMQNFRNEVSPVTNFMQKLFDKDLAA